MLPENGEAGNSASKARTIRKMTLKADGAFDEQHAKRLGERTAKMKAKRGANGAQYRDSVCLAELELAVSFL